MIHILSPTFFLSHLGVGVSSSSTAAIQPASQPAAVQAAPQSVQTPDLQPQATPQHQQLLIKQQQATAFLSPQSNQQVGKCTLAVNI